MGRWPLLYRFNSFSLLLLFLCVVFSVSPSIDPQSQEIYISSTKPAFLPCKPTGIPAPSVYWTVTHSEPTNITQGTPVLLETRIGDETTEQVLKVFENGTLHISEVDYPDSRGHYQCTAVNRLGIAKGDIRLTVVGGMAGFTLHCQCGRQDDELECSIGHVRYINILTWFRGFQVKFGVVFFVSKSRLGIEGQKKLEKVAILTRKPRTHARILIYRTWSVTWLNLLARKYINNSLFKHYLFRKENSFPRAKHEENYDLRRLEDKTGEDIFRRQMEA